MKKVILLMSIICSTVFINDLNAQQWKDNLPQGKLKSGELTFYEIQKAFNDYWGPLNVKNGFYKNAKGIEVRAQGWKQFKRWEWYWENRIVKETGAFPKTSASEELAKYLLKNPGGDSPNGTWTSLGPTNSQGGYAGLGRLNCVGFVPGDNNTFYIGSPSGGIWKTSNGGTSWIPLGDYNAVLGVSDIVAYRPASSPDVIYIATGDRDGGSMWSLGGGQYNDNNSVGVLKSTDGGTTWNTTGLSFTASQGRMVNRLLLNPSDNNILYAATSVGVYKTINGGADWTMIYSTEFIDMEFMPGNPSTIYGSTFHGDIYRSINDGSTWTPSLTTDNARTELAVSANNPSIVYAISDNANFGLAGIYKSTDGGTSFTQVFSGSTRNLLNWDCNSTTAGGQGWYDLCIASDPANANIVFIGGVNTWKSADGGTTWTISNHYAGSCGVVDVHADQHCLIYQNGTSTLFECNDGGVYKTVNSGSTWTYLGSGVTTSQIYRLDVAQTVANETILGLQDNGTKALFSGSWNDLLGGDGFECAIDYTNQNTMYTESYNGDIRRSTNHGGSWSTITSGLSGTAWWCTPYVIDPNVNTTLYIGYQDVWKSVNQGSSWTKISSWAGSTLRSLAVAPSNSGYIYAATTSVLYRTTNGGTSWSDITGTIPVGSANITYICVKNDDPNTAWVSLGGYNSNRVYQTINGGTSWTNISAGLPSIPVMCVVQNKQSTAQVQLYAGTDVGVYVKDGSANWIMFSSGLPNVVVTELKIYYNTNTSNSRIRAATYGRGLWQSDLLSSSTAPPVADFAASNTSPAVGSQVNFTDLSTNNPTIWSWIFAPSTVTYVNGTTSASKNPQVQFTTAGLYTVTLTATNAYGSDTKTKTNYINAINCTFSTLPFTESFSGTTIPTCWTQVDNQGNGQIWQFGVITGQSPNPALNGNYAYLNSDAYGSGNSQNADLITPTLNLSAYSSVTLQFNHYFKAYSGSSGKLSYSINNGASWTLITTFSTTSSTNPAAFSQAISAVAGQSQVKFKWNYTGTFGWYWAIDDVQIACTPSPVSISVVPSGNPVLAGTSVTFTATPANGGTTPAYQWKVNGANAGTNSATYSYVPVNNDAVKCVLTSNATCATGNPATSNTVTMIVNPPAMKVLNLKVYLEGLYDVPTGLMRQAMNIPPTPEFGPGIADQVIVELHNATSPYAIVYTYSNVNLNTNGTLAITTIPGSITGSYYVVIKNRNSIETWSNSPVAFGGAGPVNYDFTTAASKAYGNNMKLRGTVYVIYGGDASQDGAVDGTDMALIDNASAAVLTGYHPQDINGDGIVDGSDMAVVDNNSTAIVHVKKP